MADYLYKVRLLRPHGGCGTGSELLVTLQRARFMVNFGGGNDLAEAVDPLPSQSTPVPEPIVEAAEPVRKKRARKPVVEDVDDG